MKGLGANKTPRAIERIGKALGTMLPFSTFLTKNVVCLQCLDYMRNPQLTKMSRLQ